MDSNFQIQFFTFISQIINFCSNNFLWIKLFICNLIEKVVNFLIGLYLFIIIYSKIIKEINLFDILLNRCPKYDLWFQF